MTDEQRPPDSTRKDDDATGTSTLVLPPRTNAPPPGPPSTRSDEPWLSVLAGFLSFVLALIVYAVLASRDLGFLLDGRPTFNDLIGGWSVVLRYVFACCCCLTGVTLTRRVAAYESRPAVAVSIGVALAVLIPLAVVFAVAAILTVALAAFGFYALFFHAGDR